MCVELERNFEAVKKKFLGVLAYFGEDSNMSSTDFFTTLHKFVLVSCTLYCSFYNIKNPLSDALLVVHIRNLSRFAI